MKKPIVAIVGRPNVGKSTLFNRIIKKREAIVDDAPGITRDRKQADAQWEGVTFTLVDTGGYMPESHDIIESGVTRQAKFAIEAADLVIFVADVTTGITDIDGDAARIIRKSAKPHILAVNKVDTAKKEVDAAEFIRLGLGDPIHVSALGGRNVGDLLSKVVELMDIAPQNDEKPKDDNSIKLAIVGRPNVGKSTFVNLILGEERLLVTEVPGTTRDSVDVKIRYQERDIILIDTAGMRRRSKVVENVEYYSTLRTSQTVEACDVACVFVDADEGLTQQDLRVVQQVTEARKGILLVVNKWDLVKGDEERIQKWNDTLKRRLKGLSYIPTIFVSCKINLRVRKILELALRISIEREKRIPSPDMNRFLEYLNKHYQPPAVGGKRVRIMYASQVGVKPPKFAFFSNHPLNIKESYKRFLENNLRDQFGFEGVPVSFIFKKK